MKGIFKFISFFILFFSIVFQSFAIDAPTWLDVDSQTSSSIDLSWNLVEWADWYIVYYWIESWIQNYLDQPSDPLDTNSVSLDWLDVNTTYYFSVVALDEEAEEWPYSDELIVDIVEWEGSSDTSDWESEVNFALESIDVIEYNKLELTFSSPLDSSDEAIREFKITNTNDPLDTFDVVFSEINPLDDKKVFLTLDYPTEIWNEYEVVIIAITNFEGDNIESWIDNSEVFFVETIVEKPAEEVIDEENNELNSASEEQNWVSWTNLSNEEIENNTLALAEKNSKLPETWAEHILLIVLSIILWTLIFKFKKS